MAEKAICDVCGKEGRRKWRYMAPEGWFFGESKHEETGEIIVVSVCSVACCSKFFRPGPHKYAAKSGMEKEPREPEREPTWSD